MPMSASIKTRCSIKKAKASTHSLLDCHRKSGRLHRRCGFSAGRLDEAVKYTKTRLANGKPISDMQGIRFELADLHAKIEACRWLTYRTAMLHEVDDSSFQTEAAACKLFVQPVVTDVISTALRLHGAYGYTTDFKIERLYRAQPGNVVISVSLEINKAIVGASLVK